MELIFLHCKAHRFDRYMVMYIWPFNFFEPIKGTGEHELIDDIISFYRRFNRPNICSDGGAISTIDARIRYQHLPYYFGNIVYYQDTNKNYELGIDKNYGSRLVLSQNV